MKDKEFNRIYRIIESTAEIASYFPSPNLKLLEDQPKTATWIRLEAETDRGNITQDFFITYRDKRAMANNLLLVFMKLLNPELLAAYRGGGIKSWSIRFHDGHVDGECLNFNLGVEMKNGEHDNCDSE